MDILQIEKKIKALNIDKMRVSEWDELKSLFSQQSKEVLSQIMLLNIPPVKYLAKSILFERGQIKLGGIS